MHYTGMLAFAFAGRRDHVVAGFRGWLRSHWAVCSALHRFLSSLREMDNFWTSMVSCLRFFSLLAILSLHFTAMGGLVTVLSRTERHIAQRHFAVAHFSVSCRGWRCHWDCCRSMSHSVHDRPPLERQVAANKKCCSMRRWRTCLRDSVCSTRTGRATLFNDRYVQMMGIVGRYRCRANTYSTCSRSGKPRDRSPVIPKSFAKCNGGRSCREIEHEDREHRRRDAF